MKKKLAIILACVMLCATVVMAGCSGSSYSKIAVNGKQDYSYTVYSNGGNSVQYGNYIYFINGTKGYEDADGKQNTWNDVTKGALYRAELTGVKDTVNLGDFTIQANADGKEFVSTKGLDYDENSIDIVNVQLIAPKVIGTSGYNDGGIFIYDEYVYYATPNNEKDKTGTVQAKRTDFFRTKLDGSDTAKIYTTEAETATSPYAFHKKGDSVYLVVLSGTEVISVECTNKKIMESKRIAKDVKSALLPYRTTYKKGDTSVVLEDFVYILRDTVEGSDPLKTGTNIEVMECDGVAGRKVISLGKTDTALEAVRDGMLYYRSPNQSNNTAIYYTNLHDALMGTEVTDAAEGIKGIKSYQDYQLGLAEDDANKIGSTIKGELFSSEKIADYTKTYCFRPGGIKSNINYAIGIKADGAFLISDKIETRQIYNAALTFSFVDGEYMYFTDSDAKTLYSTEWEKTATEKSAAGTLKIKSSDADITDNGLKPDITAGYLVYMSDVDTWAKGYANFKKIDGIEGAKQQFVGAKIEADLKPKDEEEEEEKKKGCGSIANSTTGSISAVILVITAGALLTFTILKKKKSKI